MQKATLAALCSSSLNFTALPLGLAASGASRCLQPRGAGLSFSHQAPFPSAQRGAEPSLRQSVIEQYSPPSPSKLEEPRARSPSEGSAAPSLPWDEGFLAELPTPLSPKAGGFGQRG